MSKLIDLDSLALFKTNMDAEIDAKIAAAIGSGDGKDVSLFDVSICCTLVPDTDKVKITGRFIDNEETFLTGVNDMLVGLGAPAISSIDDFADAISAIYDNDPTHVIEAMRFLGTMNHLYNYIEGFIEASSPSQYAEPVIYSLIKSHYLGNAKYIDNNGNIVDLASALNLFLENGFTIDTTNTKIEKHTLAVAGSGGSSGDGDKLYLHKMSFHYSDGIDVDNDVEICYVNKESTNPTDINSFIAEYKNNTHIMGYAQVFASGGSILEKEYFYDVDVTGDMCTLLILQFQDFSESGPQNAAADISKLNSQYITNTPTFTTEIYFAGGSGTVEAEPIISIKMTNLDCRYIDTEPAQIADIQFYCTKERWDKFVALTKELSGIDITYDNFGEIFAQSTLERQTLTAGYLLNDYLEGKILPNAYLSQVAPDAAIYYPMLLCIATEVAGPDGSPIKIAGTAQWSTSAYFPDGMDRESLPYTTQDTVITVTEINNPIATGEGSSKVEFHADNGLIQLKAKIDTGTIYTITSYITGKELLTLMLHLKAHNPEFENLPIDENTTTGELVQVMKELCNDTSLTLDTRCWYAATFIELGFGKSFDIAGIGINGDQVCSFDVDDSGSFGGDAITYKPYHGASSELLLLIDNVTSLTMNVEELTSGTIITSGGTSVGGSGKLYEYRMNLEAYDYEGNTVIWDFNGLRFSTNPNIVISIYESNFEKLKEVFLSIAQQMGVTITLDSPQDLATIFNTYFNETGEGDWVTTSLLITTAMLADKITINSSEAALPVGIQMFPWTGISNGFSIIEVQGIRSFGLIGLKHSEGGSEDYAYGLNANNTCKLIEYGTSSSGGSSKPQENPFCYMQFTDLDTGYIFFTFDRARLNNTENVTLINKGIQDLNNIFSLEIPAYTNINDMQDISEYIHNLSEDYAQAKVVFWAQFLTVATRMSISMKAYKQSVATAPIITAIADAEEGYTYAIRYFDISGQFVEWWDSNTHHNFRLYVDNMD